MTPGLEKAIQTAQAFVDQGTADDGMTMIPWNVIQDVIWAAEDAEAWGFTQGEAEARAAVAPLDVERLAAALAKVYDMGAESSEAAAGIVAASYKAALRGSDGGGADG